MYNYSSKHSPVRTLSSSRLNSLENLPAVPEFEKKTRALGNPLQPSWSIYETVDNLDVEDERDGEVGGVSELEESGAERKDAFQRKMDTIEESMRRVTAPRFKLPDRAEKLAENRDVFADIDRSNIQNMEIYIPKLGRGDVLCVDVVCVPSDMRTFDLIDVCEGSFNKPVDHEPLDVMLSPSPPSSLDGDALAGPTARPHSPFLPVYHNGEYEFNLTSAHGITAGRYLLSVTNTGNYTQSIRAKMKIRPYVQATAIDDHEPVTVNDVAQNEFCFFRFVLKDRTSFVSIRVTPQGNATGTASDPDLYVSNKYSGLVAVDRDNYIWRSTNVGLDQVDIHPDDLNAKRSGIFIIGVQGYKDVNSFTLEVNVSSPIRSIDLKPGSQDLLVRTDRYVYYRLKVDSMSKNKLYIDVTPLDELGFASSGDGRGESKDPAVGKLSDMDRFGRSDLEHRFGRGVYTLDSLSSSGIFAPHRPLQGAEGLSKSLNQKSNLSKSIDEAIAAQLARASDHKSGAAARDKQPSDDELCVLLDSLPDSVAKQTGVFPLLHLSSECMYPTAESHTWRASSISGAVKAMVESSEWQHTTSKYCYFSVIGLVLPRARAKMNVPRSPATPSASSGSGAISPSKLTSPILPELPSGSSSGRFMRSQNTVSELRARSEEDATPTSIPCRISLEIVSEGSDLSSTLQSGYKTFTAIFEDVDGSFISHNDRMKSGQIDSPNLAFGEIEYPSFVRLLEDVGARDGQVFADLGCGCGKAVVAASLSGIKFIRCIGIEVLPGLCRAALSAIEKCEASRGKPASPQRRPNQQRGSAPRPSHSERSSSFPMLEIWEGDFASMGQNDADNKASISWSQADVVFASSICFTDTLMQNMLNIAKEMKRGGLLLTLKLPDHYNAHFKLFKQEWVKMSWGRCLVYVLQRL